MKGRPDGYFRVYLIFLVFLVSVFCLPYKNGFHEARKLQPVAENVKKSLDKFISGSGDS